MMRRCIRTVVVGMLFLFGLGVVRLGAQEATRVVVKVEMANIRSAPSSTAPVVTRVPRGTVLEVVERRGPWLKVILEFPNAEPVEGYIAASLVEPAPAPREAPPPRPAPEPAPPPPPPPPPPPVRPAPPPPAPARPVGGTGLYVRLFGGVNPGVADGYGQTAPEQITYYFEPAPLEGRYRAGVAPVVGLGFEYRPSPRFGVGLEGEFMLGKAEADLTVGVPHPLLFGVTRPSEADGVRGFAYRRFGGSLYGAYFAGSALSVRAGLSVHVMRFESVAGLEIRESGYPYDDPPTITGVVKASGSGVVFGGFLGLGLALRLGDRLAVEVEPRVLFSAGSPTGPLGEEIGPKAVSFRALAGLRFRP